MLRLFGAYCTAHRHNEGITILEDGMVTYCPFWAWPLGYIDWGYDAIESTRVEMAKVFFPSCVSCWRQWLGARNSLVRDMEASR